MPFPSKRSWRACFATKGFGGRVNCREWAHKTKSYKNLPEKVAARTHSKTRKR